ncbi:porin family protein [Flavobacterium lacus]|uniref:Outer membrane protein with beta-barrel domain n=1 Tax=Flavobacterium lacus TaxID=1353778 RepID=A0A328WKG5_9FLAO|nr:hypothetical protein [Flavobacterium lacus]RAR46731.1 hypothetical protein B0I10_11540 [Flavobacterium lacus]
MKNLLLFALFLVSINLLSQNKWEDGKIEFENGTILECQIKNENWAYNPESVKFINQNGVESIAGLAALKSFEILNKIKYIKASVDIETSSAKLGELTATREAFFENKVVLLKTLIDGKADLFMYQYNRGIRYFYRVDDSTIKSLIFKTYLYNNTHVMTNKDFIYQLNTDVNCGDSRINANKINYNENDLIKYFEKYNTCSNSVSTKYEVSNKADFNINLFAGVSFVKSTFESESDIYINNSSSNVTAFRFGSQFEVVLPLKRKNFSFFAELSYFNFNATYVENNEPNFITASPFFTSTTTIKMKRLDVMLGLKYYIHLSELSSVFIEGYYNIGSVNSRKNILESILTAESEPERIRSLAFKAIGEDYYGFGAGFRYNNKFSVGLRMSGPQNSIKYITGYDQKNLETSIIAAYTIF